MNRWLRLQRLSIALIGVITVAMIAAGVATLYIDDIPKPITLVFGLAGGFAAGSLVGMLFVQAALNSFIMANTRPETLDDILRMRRRG